MIELRNFHTERRWVDDFTGESMMFPVVVLQYRQTINDEDFMRLETIWSEWVDVPDVRDENQ